MLIRCNRIICPEREHRLAAAAAVGDSVSHKANIQIISEQ